MTTLRDLVKDRKLYSVEATHTVLEAARFMMEHNIGALPVLRNGQLTGILSERDIVYGLIDHGADVLDKPVSELMTGHPLTCTPQTGVKDAMRLMSTRRIRHLPVMRDGKLAGRPLIRPFGVPVEEDRDDFIADATDAAARAYSPGVDDEKVRESVRLAVRRCATLWTGKKPLVEVMMLQIAQ